MALFNLFKNKKSDLPTLQNGQTKKYDYFAFSVHSNLPRMELLENPKNVVVKLEDDTLNVYYNGKLIGNGDKQALNKFKTNCNGKWNVHSFVVYDAGRAKVRIKYFY